MFTIKSISRVSRSAVFGVRGGGSPSRAQAALRSMSSLATRMPQSMSMERCESTGIPSLRIKTVKTAFQQTNPYSVNARRFATMVRPTGELSATILGLGTYIPTEVRTNDFWPKEIVDSWSKKEKTNFLHLSTNGMPDEKYIHPFLAQELAKLVGDPFSGMQERRVSHIIPSEMEKAACLEALDDAKILPEKVDMLMSFSLPADRIYPPNAFKLQNELNLINARSFGVNAFCHSLPIGIDIAMQYIMNHVIKNALIVVSTKYSSIMDYSNSISVAAGDGAGAIVLGPCPKDKGIQFSYQNTESKFHDAMVVTRRPPRRSARSSFEYSDQQSTEKLFFTINNPTTSREIIARVPFWGKDFKDAAFRNGFLLENADLMVTNAALVWYNPVLSRIFNIPAERIEDNILKYSNMGATNLPINLYTAYKSGRIQNGTQVLLFGHGAGANYGGLLMNWYQPKD